LRILLVEDDPDLSRQLKLALADAGYAVDHAPDGEEAQYLGETEPYDAIILDLGLPKVDGVSVLERWRRENMSTPVLILTARAAWTPAPTTISPSRFTPRSCWRGCAPCCGARRVTRRPTCPAAACGSIPAPPAPASTASRCG
jgi:CheY-like chemotaxis protein